jgi:tetratricopeptide (TPR) repeat protein
MDMLEEAQSLKKSAKASKEIADSENDPEIYDEALEELEEARELLLRELSSLERDSSAGTEFQQSRRRNIARELADCFGLAGGIYRRKGQYEEAISMYNQGYEYERNPSYQIQDSYNMTNRIVLRILNEPEAFESLKPLIEEAIAIIQEQVDGPRRKEWWAWADLGLLYLLNKNEKQALKSYDYFKECGALPKHYDSSREVLVELNEKLKAVEPTISPFLTSGIDRLKGGSPPA